MECGAITLIQKPWEANRFIQTVSNALQRSKRIRIDQMHADGFQRKLDSLTDEERLVLDCIVEGKSNKEVVAMLYMSERTLDRRRATVFEKMEVETAVQLASLMERFAAFEAKGTRPNPAFIQGRFPLALLAAKSQAEISKASPFASMLELSSLRSFCRLCQRSPSTEIFR